jgi:hypothetical protein
MRSKNERPKTPGPGSYQLRDLIGNDGPKISISSFRPISAKVNSDNLQPGPGAYNSNLSDKLKSPSYGFGISQRKNNNKEAEIIPGVGSYNLTERAKSPTWSMGKSTRGNKSYTENIPGPGNYEYSNTVGNGPKVNI